MFLVFLQIFYESLGDLENCAAEYRHMKDLSLLGMSMKTRAMRQQWPTDNCLDCNTCRNSYEISEESWACKASGKESRFREPPFQALLYRISKLEPGSQTGFHVRLLGWFLSFGLLALPLKLENSNRLASKCAQIKGCACGKSTTTLSNS